MKALIFALVVIGFVTAQASESVIYTNNEGCFVEVSQTRTGYSMYVRDGSGKVGIIGVLNDRSSGTIYAFCSKAEVSMKGDVLTLSCGEQKENGAYTTRGIAKVKLQNGVSAVAIKGEVKKLFGWKTDTNILCANLKAQVN